MNNRIRAGIGFDSHPLVAGRKLVLGGVEIPFAKGLEGWSDADVLTHAVMDALLGAAALGDIGVHFPPGEAKYQGISSLVLLQKVKEKLAQNGWRVGNIDATLVAEKPRLRDFIDDMRRNLSQALGINIDCVSVKASTSNRLGAIGREEGIAVYAVVLIEGGNNANIQHSLR
jgi:2-C-methyl-D-erythritol 2,4-cyclodiphosphate synthase